MVTKHYSQTETIHRIITWFHNFGQMICMICMIYSHYSTVHDLDLPGRADIFLICMICMICII